SYPTQQPWAEPYSHRPGSQELCPCLTSGSKPDKTTIEETIDNLARWNLKLQNKRFPN
ncbi:hypothetical protein C5S42_06410, partial [Candidatus Methanomarinus sp.]